MLGKTSSLEEGGSNCPGKTALSKEQLQICFQVGKRSGSWRTLLKNLIIWFGLLWISSAVK